jgi:uncharacterized protein (TIGR02996 family)
MVMPDPLATEPFLQAIYQSPEENLPRLIFADWLDEQGAAEWAELIRTQCGLTTDADAVRHARTLAEQVFPHQRIDRGLPLAGGTIAVTPEQLENPEEFRRIAREGQIAWYGARKLMIEQMPIVTVEPLRTILTSPVSQNVTELYLNGYEATVETTVAVGDFQLIDMDIRPRITSQMVEALAGMRECRRLTLLDLTNNDLGNDALRALAVSPYFDRLRTLRLSAGNRFRGRVWQQIIERFGEHIVE